MLNNNNFFPSALIQIIPKQGLVEQSPEIHDVQHLSTVRTPAMGVVTEKGGGGQVLAAVVPPETDREERETEKGGEAPVERREEKETRGESKGRVVKTVRKKGVEEAEWKLLESDGESAPAPGRLIALRLTMQLRQPEIRKKKQNRRR